MQALHIFRAQYFQLSDPAQMRWPEAQLLKRSEAQAWLFEEMFDRDSIQYPPPERYQVRVLKQLVSVIENAIDDPEEDVRIISSPLFSHQFLLWLFFLLGCASRSEMHWDTTMPLFFLLLQGKRSFDRNSTMICSHPRNTGANVRIWVDVRAAWSEPLLCLVHLRAFLTSRCAARSVDTCSFRSGIVFSERTNSWVLPAM